MLDGITIIDIKKEKILKKKKLKELNGIETFAEDCKIKKIR